MKKKILAMALILSMAISSTIFAATDNSLSSDKTSTAGALFTGSNAPKLIIKPDGSTLNEDTSFKLTLDNAEWKCSDSGTIVAGVTYMLMGDSEMMVSIDSSVFDLSSTTLMISLETEVQEEGNATVTVDPMGSSVSAGTYTFAHGIYPVSEVEVSDYNESTNKFDFKVSDDYGYMFYARDCFKLELPSGFEFSGFDSVSGTGKYKNIVEFKIDSSNPRIAYVSTKSNAAAGSGTMTVEGIGVKALSTATDGSISIKVNGMYGESDTMNFYLFDYVKDKEEDVPVATKTEVKFTLGQKYYYVDGTKTDMDAAVMVDSNDRILMPARYIANSLGIENNNIAWVKDDIGYKAVITKGSKVIEIRAGEKFITVDKAKVEMDTSAVIKEDRIYLPLRAIANALDVSDSDIKWDDTTKTATIYR